MRLKVHFLNRRSLLRLIPASLGALALPRLAFSDEAEVHGLSSFGELALPPDFKHFAYVNPDAPKAGKLVLQITGTNGNQNFETFDTFNIYVLKGDGAAGMDMCFDSLMTGSADEPDAAYGLVARAVKISDDKLTYRFLLRPEARFHDGSKLTAKDVAFSLNILKEKGHPTYRSILTDMAGAEAESDEVVKVQLAPTRSRDLHLAIAGMPIFSAAYWADKDFEATTTSPPLGSGAYQLSSYEQGRFVEFELVADYWGKDLPVNVGQNNFARVRYEYFRERQVAFEAFKNGTITYHEEYTSRIWATGYDFPAVKDGRIKKDTLPSGAPASSQGWFFNTRRDKFSDPRIREALGLCFDFEWTNKTIMYSSYKRITSFFEGTEMKAVGKPSVDELALLEPYRGKVPDEVFAEPYLPPVSDGSGNDRTLLKKADELLRAAGCKREGSVLKLRNGKPFEIEFLDDSNALQPHTQPFQQNLGRLGIKATSRIVDPAQYQSRMKQFDFDIVTVAHGGALTPGDELKILYGSESAKTEGGRNLAGIMDPAVDALADRIAKAKTRAELNIAARALDRVLRAGRYWIPMFYRNEAWIAYWDEYSRPQTSPKYGTGAPGTWWYDSEKAKKIGLG
jgi:microcin C transport system substrate-binding protein